MKEPPWEWGAPPPASPGPPPETPGGAAPPGRRYWSGRRAAAIVLGLAYVVCCVGALWYVFLETFPFENCSPGCDARLDRVQERGGAIAFFVWTGLATALIPIALALVGRRRPQLWTLGAIGAGAVVWVVCICLILVP